jgi:hypothetical protein
MNNFMSDSLSTIYLYYSDQYFESNWGVGRDVGTAALILQPDGRKKPVHFTAKVTSPHDNLGELVYTGPADRVEERDKSWPTEPICAF